MAYGTAADVAGLAGTSTEAGIFVDPDVYVDGTSPTLTQVEDWIDQISVMVDIALANEGFVVPVIQVDVIKALALKVATFTADLVLLSHNQGRLYSDRIRESGIDSMTVIEKDVIAWVKRAARGLEAMGVPRIIQQGSQSAYSVPMGRQS